MRDLTAHFTDVFKNTIATECLKAGIDHKSEVGYSVGGGGAISPIVIDGQIQGFGPTWIFTFSLRSLLLGNEPIGGSLPIHNVLPTDDEIKNTAKRLVTDVAAARTAQFKDN